MTALAEVRYLPGPALQQVETRYDVEFGVYWAFMKPRGRQCFNEALLDDLRTYIDSFVHLGGFLRVGSELHAVRFGVLASKAPRVFNLGGDLQLFRWAIQNRNKERLLAYGEKCIDNLFPWYRNCDLNLTTISLVQGDSLGGGFEAALSASVLVAEESARMGFPEILFNLFPGMGAYSFLSRKVGPRVAEELITSGNIYTARELYERGVVDILAPDTLGETALYEYVRKHARNGNGRRGFERARLESDPVTRAELLRVIHVWADTALGLSDRDLRMMDRLARAQQRINEIAVAPATDNVVSLPRSAAACT
jgi:DSF synthase